MIEPKPKTRISCSVFAELSQAWIDSASQALQRRIQSFSQIQKRQARTRTWTVQLLVFTLPINFRQRIFAGFSTPDNIFFHHDRCYAAEDWQQNLMEQQGR